MKRIMIIILALTLLFCGCGSKNKMNTISGVSVDKANKNEEIDNIQEGMNISTLASYRVDKEFRSIKLTVEAYYEGDLVKTQQILEGSLEDDDKESSGFIVMGVTMDEELIVIATEASGKNEMRMKLEDYFDNQDFEGGAMAMNSLIGDHASIKVEDGVEHFVSILGINADSSDSSISMPMTHGTAVDKSELSGTQYVLLLKCGFSTKSLS